jgi:hypothetical protein
MIAYALLAFDLLWPPFCRAAIRRARTLGSWVCAKQARSATPGMAIVGHGAPARVFAWHLTRRVALVGADSVVESIAVSFSANALRCAVAVH